MVVDDEPNICSALQRVLEMEGYRVIIAMDGKTALRLIPREKPDAVLLDIIMPGMDGTEVCARIRQISNCRIIYFTARADLVKKDGGLEKMRKADAFVTKPATAKRIRSVIDLTLGNHYH